MARIKYICKDCGTENNVVANGTYQWDYDTQGWVENAISGFERPFCGECESEDIDEVTVEGD